MVEFMIYGATGYTGRLASEYSKSLGMNFIVAGRNDGSVKQIASSLEVPYRVFNTDDRQILDSSLRGIRVLLNCAGPFMRTAEPLIDACIRCGIHYLDISAELTSYRLVEERDGKAKAANVMLLPGCGGSVAMLGCLAGHAVNRNEAATSIDVALFVAGSMSRGSAISAAGLTPECLQRQDGNLIKQNPQNIAQFDFDDGEGLVDCSPVTLPDLITMWKSTKSPNIKTFVHVSGDAFPVGDLSALPDGPTTEQRRENLYHAAVTVTTEAGITKKAVLHTANGYDFTSVASVEAARRVLDGQFRGGFQTPANMFGSGFFSTTRKILQATFSMPSYVVTGASRGLGYAFVKLLASDPSNTVIGLVRNPTATQARLTADGISNVHVIAADIADETALRNAAEETKRILNGEGLDVLINNAAYVSEITALKTLQDL
ncbi:saccharopine dehydrogenase [Trichoderma arundinaceum]|uniref:Saccharopine dehydrogenase n=1 Tax=Trichoderma arundinaceum TaxID=490622 RepID=A0A395NMP2_TRIAR|nr:saccharopine dehydrogenase [Trichoderma arundinaceum]